LIEDLKGEEDRDDLREVNRIRNAWVASDADGNGKLDQEEVIDLMKSLNVLMDEGHVRNMFREFDTDESGKLEYEEFVKLMAKINHKEELDVFFRQYGVKNPDWDNTPENEYVITVASFITFL
jgi:Ca2+-binding EF-hand superfamily protein